MKHAIEPIPVLKEITQSHKRRRPKTLGMAGYLMHRNISIYITRFLLIVTNKRIHPNTVSWINLLLIMTASILLFQNAVIVNISGFILLYFSILLDKVDGELARYLHKTTLRGIYLEQVYHFFFYPMLLVGIGLKLFLSNQQATYLILTCVMVMLFIFITINPIFVYFIVLYKRIQKLHVMSQQVVDMPGHLQTLKHFGNYLKFSTLVVRPFIALVLFGATYIIDYVWMTQITAGLFVLYAVLVVIRAVRLLLSEYATIAQNAQSIVQQVVKEI